MTATDATTDTQATASGALRPGRLETDRLAKRVNVAEGDVVAQGDVICVIEAMKMENEVSAHQPGTVHKLSVAEGDSVGANQLIAIISEDAE